MAAETRNWSSQLFSSSRFFPLFAPMKANRHVTPVI